MYCFYAQPLLEFYVNEKKSALFVFSSNFRMFLQSLLYAFTD